MIRVIKDNRFTRKDHVGGIQNNRNASTLLTDISMGWGDYNKTYVKVGDYL